MAQKENEGSTGNFREAVLGFQRETGMRVAAIEETIQGLCQLTGELTFRHTDEGILISVPDLEGNETDIIRLTDSRNESHFGVFKQSLIHKAEIKPSEDSILTGSYIPVFGIECDVTVTPDTMVMQMRPAQGDIHEHLDATIAQEERSWNRD